MTQRCKGTDGLGAKSDGSPCKGINVDPVTSYCPAHGPGSAARMRARGRLGAEATAAKNRGKGVVDSEKAPDPPETIEDAKVLAAWACHAVLTGCIDPRVAQQVTGLLREFRSATRDSDLAARMQQIEARLAELDL